MSKNSPLERDWDEAVGIVNFYMQREGLNPNQLALKANLNRSILSRFLGKKSFPDLSSMLALYIIMQGKLDRGQKIVFQRVAGLERFLAEVEKHSVHVMSEQQELQAQSPHKAGLQLMTIAYSAPWEEAILCCRRAEELFLRTAISHATKAACEIVQLQINLGDYASAQQEVKRIYQSYARTENFETEGELCRLQGWLDFHVGKYHDAKAHFKKQLELANEAGVEHLRYSGHVFLGRIYLEFAHQTHSKKERFFLLQRAHEESERELALEIKRGRDEHIAMSLLRLAQVHQAAENYRDARILRERSRDVNGTYHLPQLDIEEAFLHLDEKNFAGARVLAAKAMDALKDEKYARGISHALQLSASIELKEGHPTTAFELAIAALCAAPSDSDSRGKALWRFVNGIDRDSVCAGKWQSYEEYIRHLHEAAMARMGNFVLLKSVSFLHKEDTLDRIFSRLHPLVGHK